jgi:hypothetical protein
MNTKFQTLNELGAGDFEHLNGSLTSHLEGTYSLLKKWGASESVCDAGLFHAAYGTAGFDETMVSLDRRSEISDLLGIEVEELVYLYCACDRDFTYENLVSGSAIYKNRFTGSIVKLNEDQARNLAEMTVANELELVITGEEFREKYGKELYQNF